jgi:hypothetical protein
MRQKLDRVENTVDEHGNPTGGMVKAVGIDIMWQDGPLGRGEERKEPNGAFVEGVLESAKQRLEFYQASKYACPENEKAIANIEDALIWLDQRHKKREERQVQGTHAV